MTGLLGGGRPWQLLTDEAHEGSEGIESLRGGKGLPQLRQRDVRWHAWARGGTGWRRLDGMRLLLGALAPAAGGATPPTAEAPLEQFWAAVPRIDKV
jgi:hypothetical protein